MTERKLCSNCDYQKSVGMSIACQRCFNKSLWKPRSKTMSKQELLNYISEKYGNDKKANKLKRIVFKTYSGKYIYYANERYSFDELNKLYKIL